MFEDLRWKVNAIIQGNIPSIGQALYLHLATSKARA
jgi:hypothetical protein